MAYRTKSQFQNRIDTVENLIENDNKVSVPEFKDLNTDMKDSVQWNDPEQTLTDGATVTWNYALGGEAKVTIGGNRTLSITNMPTGRVVYGCLKVTQDGTGGRSLTLPGNTYKATVGSLLTAANAVSEIYFRYDGANFSFKIS